MNVISEGYTDSNSASTDLNNAMASSQIDGLSYLSSTIVSNGFQITTASSSSLGLVLGLSIPLSLLCIYIFI